MSMLSKLKVVEYVKETTANPIATRRRKLIAKIDEQIMLSQDANYTVTRSKWVRDKDGDKKVDVARAVKRWWHTNSDGKVILTIRYANKALELAEGKCGIELTSDSELASTLELIKQAVGAGELDDKISNAVSVKSSYTASPSCPSATRKTTN
jgi:hypothetical protein